MIQLDGSEIHPDAGLIQMDGEFVLMDEQRKERDERAGRKGGTGGRIVRQGTLLFQLPSASSSRADGDSGQPPFFPLRPRPAFDRVLSAETAIETSDGRRSHAAHRAPNPLAA